MGLVGIAVFSQSEPELPFISSNSQFFKYKTSLIC